MMNVIFLLFSLVLASQSFAQANPNLRLLQYKENKGKAFFAKSLSKFDPKLQEQLNRMIDGILFIDFGHATPELMDLYLGKKALDQLQFEYRYDTPEEPNAFDGFRKGHAFAQSQKTLTLDFIVKLHQILAPWAEPSFATNNRYGPEFQDGLHPEQLKVINDSPYLYFLPCTGIFADVPQGTDQAATPTGGTRGVIVYPRPRDIKPDTLKLIAKSHPDVYNRVLEYQKKYANEWLNQDHVLTHDLLGALLEERLLRYEAERAALGPLDTSEKMEVFTKMIASLQKDAVSIHPFSDGNGRTSRMILYYVAERESLPATRLTYPNEDEFWTVDMWAEQIRDGMVAHIDLEEGILKQVKTGQPIGRRVSLFTPVLPQEVTEETVSDYDSYLRHQFETDPNLKLKILQDPVGTFRSLKDNFNAPAKACSSVFRG